MLNTIIGMMGTIALIGLFGCLWKFLGIKLKKIKIERNDFINWKIELITIFILFIITIVWQIIIGFLVYKNEIDSKKLFILLTSSIFSFLFAIVEIILGFFS